MGQKYRVYALVAGANVEAVLYMIAAWQISGWLNDHFENNFDWALICYLLALLLIARSWYVIFRILIKKQSESERQSGDRKENDIENKH